MNYHFPKHRTSSQDLKQFETDFLQEIHMVKMEDNSLNRKRHAISKAVGHSKPVQKRLYSDDVVQDMKKKGIKSTQDLPSCVALKVTKDIVIDMYLKH